MALQDTDLLYVDRGGTSYQVTWLQIRTRTDILATDELLIQRGSLEYQVPIGDFWDGTEVSQLNDLYLVERAFQLYHTEIIFPTQVRIGVTGATSTSMFLSAVPDALGNTPSVIAPDGTVTPLTATGTSYTFTQNGIYTLQGDFTNFKIRGSDGTVDASLTDGSVWNTVFAGVPDLGNEIFSNINELSGVPNGLALRSLFLAFMSTSPSGDLSTLDTSAVTNAHGAFLNSDIDPTDNIATWDTSNISDFSRMFSGASVFDVDISGWDVSSATNMAEMFGGATVFNADISGWDVSNATEMQYLFNNATTFNQDLGAWNVSNVEDMSFMFDGASSFNQDIGDWEVGTVLAMESMLRNTNQFDQDLSEWCVNLIPSEPTSFDDGSALQASNVPVWGTCPGVEYNGEFYFTGGSTRMTLSGTLGSAGTITQPDGTTITIGPGNWSRTITQQGTYQLPMETMTALSFDNSNNRRAEFSFAPNFYTGALTTTYRMFYDCERFVGTNIGNWDMSQVTNMSRMFESAVYFDGPIDNWDVSNVTNMADMFMGAFVFNQPVNSWNVSSVTNMHAMFSNCLVWDQDLDQWNMSGVTDISQMLYRARELRDPNIGGWDVSNVTRMDALLGSSVLANPDLSAWDTSNVSKNGFAGMFDNARAFNSDISGWSVNNEDDMSFNRMFEDAHSFNQDLSSWDMSRAGNTGQMFQNARAFNQDISGWEFSPTWDTANNMFAGATVFNQDISNWCAAGISSKPSRFDNGSAFEGETALQPQWGECPFPGSGNFTITDFQTSTSLGLTIRWYGGGSKDITGPSGPITVSNGTRVNLTELGTYDIPMGSVEGLSFSGAADQRNVVFDFAADFYTGSVSNMRQIFENCEAFNGDIANWDTSSVTTFRAAFNNAHVFNGDISAWDTSSAEDMTQMFRRAFAFNSAIGDWDLSSLAPYSSLGVMGMFDEASAFNQPLHKWDVSRVSNMGEMFADAVAFNQWLNPWDVSNTTNMTNMFRNAAAMNSDISNWCVAQIATSPSGFAINAGFAGDLSLQPDWGECSAFNGIYLEDLVGGTGDLVIAGTGRTGESGNIRQPDGTLTAWGAGNFANKFTQLGWYEIQNMEGLDGLRFFDNDVLGADTSETALFRLSPTINTSTLTETRQMFREALLFNGDVSMLDVSNATNMAGMFRNAATFDQDVSHFETYNATNMSNMFRGATRFNRDISEWNTATVSGMSDMFNAAAAFNQNLSDWCVPLIGSEPSSFDSGSAFDGQTARQPSWGGCPSDFTIDTDVVIGTATGADPVLFSTEITITAAAVTTPAGVSVTSSQWQKSDDGGVTFTDIDGATGVTYTVAGADRNAQIRLVQTMENGATSPVRTTTSNVLTVEDTLPNPDSYQSSSLVVSTSNATFSGAILHSDGRLWTIPFNARETVGFLATDFTDQIMYPQTGSGTSTLKLGGGTIIPDGRILWMNYYARNATIFDPTATTDADRFINFRSKGGGGLYGFYGAIVSSLNNKIYGLPYRYDNIVEVDPVNYTVEDVPNTSHSQYFVSGVEGPDQKIYLSAGTTKEYAVFDPAVNSFETRALPYGTTYGTTRIGSGGTYVASNNSIYMSPGQVLEIVRLDFNNLDANGHPTITLIDLSSVTTGGSQGPQYMKPHIRGDGKLIFVPKRGNTPFILLDPTDDSFIPVQNNMVSGSSTGLRFEGSIMLSDGRIIAFPYNGSSQPIGVLETYLPNPNDPTSIATNYMQ